MADKSKILSADAEAALLKPIDEYVGKIQSQIDALRVDGSDKVQSYKNQIALRRKTRTYQRMREQKQLQQQRLDLKRQRAWKQQTRIRYPS